VSKLAIAEHQRKTLQTSSSRKGIEPKEKKKEGGERGKGGKKRGKGLRLEWRSPSSKWDFQHCYPSFSTTLSAQGWGGGEKRRERRGGGGAGGKKKGCPLILSLPILHVHHQCQWSELPMGTIGGERERRGNPFIDFFIPGYACQL